ncbi:MAG: 3,4-dihydroxy-2-butanone-4-phosphate synthase [Alphaproteobacteria bacterium]|nr:3,4-dihydroxy-2-butanone-4-phosphate synthase [Alphaproteobacteria bacterium]MBU6473781.1 3,4-dihydroxy-2-butanone-4-phosphate synthase [Alphaproteobacteria bacterium]MDE2012475.1 3,4-dihydroxy-2-butanone-4-phosphate synthase [Alphaproteobacteria bacterium]MDE2074614.1 3,4-dihydroxy-2-butanone-4-phosphate synthase [Alphaproteobacteria bacterium]MDE2352512.1 3,4-dihydroxy-2-butanone-4-phosphate synthase [Alphaproteobacteria bacterium]
MTVSVYHDYISRIEDVIEDARNGRMFILMDADDRENEGDLVIPAQMCTPEAVNFMAKHGRGLICLSITQDRAGQLKIPMMTQVNGAQHQTAFTVSIEAKEGVSTGISAHDRAHTIAVAIDSTKGPDDIVMPGHVFPLVARHGGTLVRAGHTEAAVDIARLAGLYPAGVICEIMNDDGTMARLPDLVQFAQHHGLKIGTIADLIAYRRRYDHFVERAVDTTFPSHHGGDWKMMVYVNTLEYGEHIALVKGDITTPEPVLVRMHALNIFSDVLGYKEYDEGVLPEAMRIIAREGRGVVVLLRQAKPTFVSDTVLRRVSEDVERRRVKEYGVGAQILLDLGVKDMILLTDTPEKKAVALDGYGLNIVGTHAIRGKEA